MEKRRLYSWSLIAYGTEEEIKRICSEAQHYAYIYHGVEEGKEPHYHILATFKTWKSLTSLKVILNNGQNVLGQKLIDKLAAYRYLTHKDNPEKVQYNDAAQIFKETPTETLTPTQIVLPDFNDTAD